MKAYGWIGFVAVYIAYTIAFLFGSNDPVNQLNAAFVTLGGVLFIVIIVAKITFENPSYKHSRFGKKVGWALHSIVFSILAEFTSLIFVFAFLAVMYMSMEKNPVPLISKEFYLPITYFVLSVDNRFFSWLIKKKNKVILPLAAVFLFSLFTWPMLSDPVIGFLLIALSGSPIIYWVFSEKIPQEIKQKNTLNRN